ncbi:hypothetical protein ACF08M_12580 [Streptomyces sp. NPDC015032]|uniref:hypothetical protein n=1 Tax=Streptomyces sp. NPDC015032 TaxID=3364937 RepID=UPI0037008D47
MKVDPLIIPGCPNAVTAADRLRRALGELGRQDMAFRTRTITGHADAEAACFTGSPTVLIDGWDLFEEPGRAPGPACRLYQTADGSAGGPTRPTSCAKL